MFVRRINELCFIAVLSAGITGCGGGGGGSSADGDGDNIAPVQGTQDPPVIQFTASPQTVTPGGDTTLSWDVINADSCAASGDWSGARPTRGQDMMRALASNAAYTLSCSGSGGTSDHTVAVTVSSSGASISGNVDSSYIDRGAINSVYIFSGQVTPDDYDGGAGDAVMDVPVSQQDNSCLWRYSVGSMAAGDYTLAFTNEAESDDPQRNDDINFQKTITVTVSDAPITADMSAQQLIRVGPGRNYTTPSQAASVASDGAVIEIDAGVYDDDIAVWRQDRLTLRGVGGRAHMRATREIPYTQGSDSENGKGIWVMYGRDIRVENMEFSGAAVPDENGAGIRGDGNGLTVCNGYFHDNENGILGGGGDVFIEYSEFDNNGLGEYGRTHNMYINGQRLTVRHSYTHHANVGHNIKSRAAENYILYNRIMDETSGNASYGIDVPNGGLTYVIGNLIQQGSNASNSTMVSYGAEGLSSGRTHRLYMANNTLVNDRSAGVFVYVRSGTERASLINNIFAGNGTVVSGAADLTTNLVTNNAGLVDRAGFDYRIVAASPARDAGSDPGIADGFSLQPQFEYSHAGQRETRNTDGAIDIGAYEY